MLFVPLTGDSIATQGGVTHVVLSYSAYKATPAVYVEGEDASTKTVSLSDIVSINGTKVSQAAGKVFSADTLIKRKIQLPQVNDKVVIDGAEPITIKVKSLKLFERGNIASGMQVVGVNDESKEPASARLADVIQIERANGTSDFSRRAFAGLYKNYMGAQ